MTVRYFILLEKPPKSGQSHRKTPIGIHSRALKPPRSKLQGKSPEGANAIARPQSAFTSKPSNHSGRSRRAKAAERWRESSQDSKRQTPQSHQTVQVEARGQKPRRGECHRKIRTASILKILKLCTGKGETKNQESGAFILLRRYLPESPDTPEPPTTPEQKPLFLQLSFFYSIIYFLILTMSSIIRIIFNRGRFL